jgi:uncharacterized surface protein with fasciclin (FAS1) repeats
MTRFVPFAVLGAAALSLAACGGGDQANGSAAGQSGAAQEAAGNKTIAAGLNQNGRFFQAAKAAGLDATLAGPGPYTVIAPDDAAFGKLPAGTADSLMQPQSRAQLTGLLTYHILPGTVLAADIGKAIDNAQGRAVLATMGGGTLTATREGERIILADASGARATVTQPDQQFSNGVVHTVDTVLTPAAAGQGGAPGAPGGAAQAPGGATPPAQ